MFSVFCLSNYSDAGCEPVGPWDCAPGAPLTVEACCSLIQSDPKLAGPDVNGNMIGCHPDFPVGSVSKPRVAGRICIHVNALDIVVHPPRNE